MCAQTKPIFEGPSFSIRQSRLKDLLHQDRLDGMALNPGPSLTYLTGLHFHLSERPVIALFPVSLPPVIILPELETAKLADLDYPITSLTYGEDPAAWSSIFAQGLSKAGLVGKSVGLEPSQMRVLELNLLEEASNQTHFVAANQAIASLRLRKDASEAAAMRVAVKIAQDALEAALPAVYLGMTEREFAAELTLQLLRHGSDPAIPFSPIVSCGPNSANPHASPSDRPFQPGELLVVDWGAAFQGYISDLTRTFALGEIVPEYERIAQLTAQANAAGREACRPGVTAESVDQAARGVIETGGYGKFFFHRTGHGIGMEGHEEPYIRQGNRLVLEPGMCFTVEPGIYLPGQGGVRVEDNVLITSDGAECFSDLPRQLRQLPF